MLKDGVVLENDEGKVTVNQHSFCELIKHLLVHYAGADKPWNCVRCDEAARFWAYARETPFHEELVRSADRIR